MLKSLIKKAINQKNQAIFIIAHQAKMIFQIRIFIKIIISIIHKRNKKI